ncbi:uncharacterized protein LOC143249517 [Tachypleus tridentatus]|uniref:uncharacterized protein LOC143249517 n=1 Tax=Tachypleus tridentatus TaxID=6853 RepID=UPI003FD4C522
MKDQPLDGQRGKVAAPHPTKPICLESVKTELKNSVTGTTNATNFDDDYNEWELGIGELIIDLDADIEKNNQRSGQYSQSKGSGIVSASGAASLNLLTTQGIISGGMSNCKSPRTNSGGSCAGSSSITSGRIGNMGALVEHQATVDKGLKMKIKRKHVGSRSSEAKHEIVQSDTKTISGTVVSSANGVTGPSSSEGKSKHSSSKGRSSSHKEKKDKNRDKEKNKACEINGIFGITPISGDSISFSSLPTPTVSLGLPTGLVLPKSVTDDSVLHDDINSANVMGSCAPSLVNHTPKVDSECSSACANSSVVSVQEDITYTPLKKKLKVETEEENNVDGTFCSRETKHSSTSTSVGTLIEPECLGPCEPGTSVILEGIVWQETDGGVLVVNVTWRGKSYVGTLLDCTKHDWDPPRFCESPTSDIDAKPTKGRGKRGRGSSNSSGEVQYSDTRTIQSKLRNGKGRRSAVITNPSRFTVPNNPVKSVGGAAGSSKKKGRSSDTETISSPNEAKYVKKNRSQMRSNSLFSTTLNLNTEISQPSSPEFIECPEPNCNKKYKHINGLRYHQSHAHNSSDSGKLDEEGREETKDVTNSSDNNESLQEPSSVPPSPSPSLRSSASPSPLCTKGEKQGESSLASSGLQNEDLSSFKPLVSGLELSEPLEACKSSPIIKFASASSSSSSSTEKTDLVPSESVEQSHLSTKSTISYIPVTFSQSVEPEIQNTVSYSISKTLSQVFGNISVSNDRLSTLITTANTTIPSVTVSIPTSQFLSLGQGQSQSNLLATTKAVITPNLSVSLSTVQQMSPTNNLNTVTSLSSSGVSASLTSEKNKSKQEKLEKSKLKSSTIRPIVPAPIGQIITTATSTPITHPTYGHNGHSMVTSSLKPIQPKPTILGEPTTINPVLEGLKKEKNRHKRKSKEKEKDKKVTSVGNSDKKPLDSAKPSLVHSFPIEHLQNMNLNSISRVSKEHQELLTTNTGVKVPCELHLEINTIDSSNISENVQSPAYSDISDDNETAPVLESEVQVAKSKEEKSTDPENQATPTNLSPYGMFSYYSPPPYLIPAAPPSVPVSLPCLEKPDIAKNFAIDKNKENKTRSEKTLSSSKEKESNSHEYSEQKNVREEHIKSSSISTMDDSYGAATLQHAYPYSYNFISGYPCSVDPSYHMRLLATDSHYKQQCERYIKDKGRLLQDHSERHEFHNISKDNQCIDAKNKNISTEKISPINPLAGVDCASDLTLNKKASLNASAHQHKERGRDNKNSGAVNTRIETSPAVLPSFKEKQIENHQILKENIELKSQMDNKPKLNQLEAVRLYKRELEIQRYNMLRNHYMDQQKSDCESQTSINTLQQNEHTLHPDSRSSSRKLNPLNESSKLSSVTNSPKNDLHKFISRSISNTSPKPVSKDSHSKDNNNSSSCSSSSVGNTKKDSMNSNTGKHHEIPEIKNEKKNNPEGQKPTMETTGPPPPPTNSYGYLHPSYLEPPHFGHMPFEGHPMYRTGLNPILMSSGAPYGNPPYLHPQLRYHVSPGPCDIPPHSQASPATMVPKVASNAPKALDLLHQVSQHYSSHKIHELQDRAMISPGPISTPSSTVTSASSSKPSSDTTITTSKQETSSSGDRSHLPPPQRHLHTHHHTHVGVGYPLYDPYGALIASQHAAASSVHAFSSSK